MRFASDPVEKELQRLREEVDALRDFILARAMSSADYEEFRKIPCYALPASRKRTEGKDA